MREVTRIRIAELSYDIEIEAKKEMASYLKALETYSEGADMMNDVEIRITEILADRDIKKDQMISIQDVKALKEQLGDPREFMSDDDNMREEGEGDIDESMSRKLFRDTDHAVMGGVLSGVAAFFGVSPVVTRVIFILLMFASFGTALLVYLLLWAVVPPAKTAADKLQMMGLPVNIASIRKINEDFIVKPARIDSDARKSLLTIAGILCVIGAMGTAFLTVAVSLAVFFNRYRAFSQDLATSHLLLGALICAIASGLLLSALLALLAYAAFVRKMTKRIIVSICIVTSLGFLSFSTAVGMTQYVVFKVRYEQNTDQGTPQPVIQELMRRKL